MSKKTQNWAVPLIAILLGMLVGAVSVSYTHLTLPTT